ncbi:Bug family tripartite tricarboxylate transporter substrate binding protein [Paracraurococcus ruber]|nr:tripartite tricarboxylate transporter substrate binding protein [Paracraurococcus ruber]
MPRILALLALVAGLASAGPARAQSAAVIVTSFGPASAADIVARLLAAEFQPLLGRPFAVKNVTGAAGTIAVNEVVRARPDGETLLFTPIGPIAIQPSFLRNAGYKASDLAPICMVNRAPLIMMTPQGSGLRTVADVVKRAKQAAAPMPYASTGMGTTPHLSMVTFARAASLKMDHIVYRGPSDVMVAFQQGAVEIFNDHPSSVRANNLHPIAVLNPERVPDFPDLPTMREQGFDVNFAIWHGLFAPAATPPAVIARYEAACETAVRSEAMRVGHERITTPIVFQNARDFGATVAADARTMASVIEEGGLRQAE